MFRGLESLNTLLIKTVDEWDHCLREAVNFQFPKAFQLFSFILIFPNTINARELYLRGQTWVKASKKVILVS